MSQDFRKSNTSENAQGVGVLQITVPHPMWYLQENVEELQNHQKAHGKTFGYVLLVITTHPILHAFGFWSWFRIFAS